MKEIAIAIVASLLAIVGPLLIGVDLLPIPLRPKMEKIGPRVEGCGHSHTTQSDAFWNC